jgi:uncharacterized protein YacL
MDAKLREKIMNYKEEQLKKFKLSLVMTGIAGILVLLYIGYLMFVAEQLADADKGLCDNLYGIDVIIFSAAIGCAYSFINFNNLRQEDKKLNRDYFVEFKAQTERFVTGAQGIFVCNLFTFVYWLAYTTYLHITYYVDRSGEYHNVVFQNRIGLALMLIALIFSYICMRYGTNMRNKLGLSKEELENMKKKKVVRRG